MRSEKVIVRLRSAKVVILQRTTFLCPSQLKMDTDAVLAFRAAAEEEAAKDAEDRAKAAEMAKAEMASKAAETKRFAIAERERAQSQSEAARSAKEEERARRLKEIEARRAPSGEALFESRKLALAELERIEAEEQHAKMVEEQEAAKRAAAVEAAAARASEEAAAAEAAEEAARVAEEAAAARETEEAAEAKRAAEEVAAAKAAEEAAAARETEEAAAAAAREIEEAAAAETETRLQAAESNDAAPLLFAAEADESTETNPPHGDSSIDAVVAAERRLSEAEAAIRAADLEVQQRKMERQRLENNAQAAAREADLATRRLSAVKEMKRRMTINADKRAKAEAARLKGFSGWAAKKGGSKRDPDTGEHIASKFLFGRRNWKTRFFVLDGRHMRLDYFDRQGASSPLGFLDLTKCNVASCNHHSHQHCFSFDAPGRDSFLMALATAEEYAEWLEAFSTAGLNIMDRPSLDRAETSYYM
mmetsp:Transcript_29440/g.95898  ORF Transcript_29440/g.95898 Transcript_29440/m.95898 type:complete len:477 (+) Transcript_29440:404-1834(+)